MPLGKESPEAQLGKRISGWACGFGLILLGLVPRGKKNPKAQLGNDFSSQTLDFGSILLGQVGRLSERVVGVGIRMRGQSDWSCWGRKTMKHNLEKAFPAEPEVLARSCSDWCPGGRKTLKQNSEKTFPAKP